MKKKKSIHNKATALCQEKDRGLFEGTFLIHYFNVKVGKGRYTKTAKIIIHTLGKQSKGK